MIRYLVDKSMKSESRSEATCQPCPEEEEGIGSRLHGYTVSLREVTNRFFSWVHHTVNVTGATELTT